MNGKYRLSQWTKIFTYGDISALFHSLQFTVVYVESKMVDYLRELIRAKEKRLIADVLGEETFQILLKEQLLVLEENNDIEELQDLRDDLLKKIPLNLMYLLLTDGCNLKCRYCFEDTPDAPCFQPTLMSSKTVEKALRLFGRLTKKYGNNDVRRVVHIYGGEPLLNKSVLLETVRLAELLKNDDTLPSNTKLVIVTNGLLLDNELAEKLAQNEISIGISIDGPRAINNKYRVSASQDVDVFARARKAYETALAHNIPTGISVTLTPDVVNSFDEVLDFFVNDMQVFGGISFNILHYNPAVKVDHVYFEKAAKCLITAFELFREKGIHEERMMRKVDAFANQKPMLADCGVGGNQLVISPDGSIGVCQDFVKSRTYFSGSVYNDQYDPVKEGVFEEWKRRSPLFMDQCIECEAIAICGGGCPASVELQTGSRWNIDERICPHSKLTLEWLIWDAYRRALNE